MFLWFCDFFRSLPNISEYPNISAFFFCFCTAVLYQGKNFFGICSSAADLILAWFSSLGLYSYLKWLQGSIVPESNLGVVHSPHQTPPWSKHRGGGVSLVTSALRPENQSESQNCLHSKRHMFVVCEVQRELFGHWKQLLLVLCWE